MSIQRNLLQKTAQLLSAAACALALCLASGCVSPDLEPPSGNATTLPMVPRNPQAGAQTAGTGAPTNGGAAGKAAAPSTGNGATPPPTTRPTTPGAAAGSGAAEAEADAGVEAP